MNQKIKKALAYTSLIFVGIFTVTFVMFLIDPAMFGGAVAFVALFSGIIGGGLYFTLRLLLKKWAEEEAYKAGGTPNDDVSEEESANEDMPEEEQPNNDATEEEPPNVI